MELQNIDIVVPWVNPNDKEWQQIHNQYFKSKGDNSAQRTRDIGIFKYFFRGIDENCKWIRKVHLLLASKSQIPNWLNVDHPKLAIHYHKDYIPAEFLPTFNTFVIEAFFHKIPDLADNFITCNDDMIWFNKTNAEDYFKNNMSLDNPRLTEYYSCNPVHDKRCKTKSLNFFQSVLKSTVDLEEQITGKRNYYYNYHIPFGLNKSLVEFTWKKHSEKLMNALKDSRFRREHNFVSWLFRYIKLDINQFIKSQSIDTDYAFFELSDNSNLNNLKKLIETKKNVCLNDMLTIRSERNLVPKVVNMLNEKFPNKSSFEV